MSETIRTTRGYEADGPDSDGDVRIDNGIGDMLWLTRADLVAMLAMFGGKVTVES